jgi:hypothetical protein
VPGLASADYAGTLRGAIDWTTGGVTVLDKYGRALP